MQVNQKLQFKKSKLSLKIKIKLDGIVPNYNSQTK